MSFPTRSVAFRRSFRRLSHCRPLRNGVVTTASPRVASQYSPHGKSQTFHRTVLLYCLDSVLRAGGSEATGWRKVRRYAHPIELYGQAKQPNEGLPQPFRNAFHDISILTSNQPSDCFHNFPALSDSLLSRFTTFFSTSTDGYSLSSIHIKAIAMPTPSCLFNALYSTNLFFR